MPHLSPPSVPFHHVWSHTIGSKHARMTSYPTDALGKPGDDTEHQLALASADVLMHRTEKACEEANGLPVYYTEWSTPSNPFFALHDEPYAAAFVAKNFIDVAHLVHAYGYWTFSDIFDENYFSSVPFHGGFGLLTVNNVAKPSYRAVQMLARRGQEQLVVEGIHDAVRVTVARAANRSVTALCTNHAFPPAPDRGADHRVVVRHRRRPDCCLHRADR